MLDRIREGKKVILESLKEKVNEDTSKLIFMYIQYGLSMYFNQKQ